MKQNFLSFLDVLYTLPRDIAHKILFNKVKGYDLNLENPKDFDEKIHWLLVYYYDKNVSLFADKYAARDVVKHLGYEDILTKIYGVYDSVDEIDLDKLPERFILKATHASGPKCYSICFDKSNYDFETEKAKLANALKINYALVALEYHYAYIKPRIICEELLADEENKLPTDYKIYCFNGEAKYIKVGTEREKELRMDYYDTKWYKQPFVKEEYSSNYLVPKPKNLDRMLEIASRLSNYFPTARIDFYNINGKIYFGEITLTPAGGLNKRDKLATLKYFGDLIDLGHISPSLVDREHYANKTIELLNAKYEELTSRPDKTKQDERNITELVKANQNDNPINNNSNSNGKIANNNINELLDLGKEASLDFPKEYRDSILSISCLILRMNVKKELKTIAVNGLYDAAFYDDVSLEECWQMYRNLDRILFVDSNVKLTNRSMVKLYKYIFDFIKANIDFSEKEFRPISKRNQDLVIFTTSQFLSIGHAPTLRVLDYAYTWQHDLGKKVIIINDAMMHYYSHEHLDGIVTFNFNKMLNNQDYIEHKGERFDFYQVDSLMPNLRILQILVDNIYDLNPLLVFNVGGSDILADLCTEFVTTLSQPCLFDIPVSMTEYLLLGRDYESSDDKRMSECAPYQKLIETKFNYIFKETDTEYSLEEFGINADEFLVSVVGNRIEQEMDDEFLEMIANVLCDRELISFVFIGPINDKERIINTILNRAKEIFAEQSAMIEEELLEDDGLIGKYLREMREKLNFTNENEESSSNNENIGYSEESTKLEGIKNRLYFVGSIKDASSLIALTDLNINPKRTGGGRAAFEALYNAIPTVSLRVGDAYYAAGKDFGVDDYKEYEMTIIRYSEESDFYVEQAKKARIRAEELSNMEETHRKILERVLNDNSQENE